MGIWKQKEIENITKLLNNMKEYTKLEDRSCKFVCVLTAVLPNGEKVKLLDDTKVYLGYQVQKENSDRLYGLVADKQYLLVCEYECSGADAEIVVYKRR